MLWSRPATATALRRWPKPYAPSRWHAGKAGNRNPAKPSPTSVRRTALTEAGKELAALGEDIRNGVPYDLCAVRLEGAAAALAEITGLDTPDDVLNRIFASFCIGK